MLKPILAILALEVIDPVARNFLWCPPGGLTAKSIIAPFFSKQIDFHCFCSASLSIFNKLIFIVFFCIASLSMLNKLNFIFLKWRKKLLQQERCSARHSPFSRFLHRAFFDNANLKLLCAENHLLNAIFLRVFLFSLRQTLGMSTLRRQSTGRLQYANAQCVHYN